MDRHRKHDYSDSFCPIGKDPIEKRSKVSRPQPNYHYHKEKFQVDQSQKEFAHQYSSLYNHRLQIMRPLVMKRAEELWGSQGIPVVSRLLELKNDDVGVVVGTIYKDMPLKPTVLKLFAKERAILPKSVEQSYVSAQDKLFLEDESGRITLRGKLDPSHFVSGLIIGIKGRMLIGGEFEADEYCFAGLPPPPPSSSSSSSSSSFGVRKSSEEESFVVLVSGLVLVKEGATLPYALLADYLSLFLGSGSEKSLLSKICRVIILGDTFGPFQVSDPINNTTNNNNGISAFSSNNAKKESDELLTLLNEVDRYVARLCVTMDVDVMPGLNDPSNYVLPQQPFPSNLFTVCSRLSTFHRVTNPYQCTLNDRTLLFCSGQTIENLKRYTEIETDIDAMKKTLEWGHLAPTAPDTLGTFPFSGHDPFILTESPHVYVTGNSSSFQEDFYEVGGRKVKLITSPKFSETKTIILLNTSTLECTPITFSVDF